MPKNKGKGGKNRRRGKNENEETKRQLEFKEPGQEYAQVVRMLGNGRCECYCFDGQTRLGHIRGKMRKKVRGRTRCGCEFSLVKKWKFSNSMGLNVLLSQRLSNWFVSVHIMADIWLYTRDFSVGGLANTVAQQSLPPIDSHHNAAPHCRFG